jgi:hypothetical protein
MKASRQTSVVLCALLPAIFCSLAVAQSGLAPTAQSVTVVPLPAGTSARTVRSGLSWVVDSDIKLKSLTLAPGGYIMAPPGKSVTLTVNGVETGLRAGRYRGDVRLTVTGNNTVKFNDALTHEFRQALYLDASGVLADKSVLAAAGSYRYADKVLTAARIRSAGENFNGIFVADGTHTVKDAVLHFAGNGGNDFAGYGAAIMATGANTKLIVDSANIKAVGAVRTAAVADKGANLIVKNSTLVANNGVLPADYVPNSALGTMKNVPWLLGLVGNNRATNLLGDKTMATYINSTLAAEEWGVLSVDLNQNAKVTAINSQVTVTGKSGYGTYAIGNSTNRLIGTQLSAPDYGAIVTGGHLVMADSKAELLSALNTELQLDLTREELAALPQRGSMITARRFGVFIWGDATVDISGSSGISSGKAAFLVKSAKAHIKVNGAEGAWLKSANGILMQIMETDNPGAVTVNGYRMTVGVYREPQTAPTKSTAFDVSMPAATDIVCDFSNLELNGDFYNAIRGGVAAAGGPGPAPPTGRNLVLNLENVRLTGAVSATTAKHAVDTITALDYLQLGEVSNTPTAAINNGVIVALKNSIWTVRGTSHLTRLTIGADAKVIGVAGRPVKMKVDGADTPLVPGDFRGQILLLLD